VAPYFKDVFDLNFEVWALWTEYDLAAHRERMLVKHPEWSERALVNCRHWQGRVRAFLHRKAETWVQEWEEREDRISDGELFYTSCPEAMGVNVTETMAGIGVKLEWPPKNITRMVYLAGIKK
jgi:hypothetical protein